MPSVKQVCSNPLLMLMIATCMIISILTPVAAIAEIKTVTHTLRQPFGGSQSPDDARVAGIVKAKREALEQFGTYIESTTIVKDSHVESDEILALTAGVTKAEVLSHKNYADGDAFGIEITVKIELDTDVLDSSLKRLLEDRNHLRELKDARDREKRLLARIGDLEREDKLSEKTVKQADKLKLGFKAASRGLTAVEWFDKAMVLWDGKRFSNPNVAVEYLTQSISLDSSAEGAYLARGIAYDSLNLIASAIEDYSQTIHLNPNLGVAYNNRGVDFETLTQFSRAVDDFSQAVSLDSNSAEVYYNRGALYIKLKQFDNAIKDFDRVVQLDSNNVQAYGFRGVGYVNTGRITNALADFNRVIDLDANNTPAYLFRANIYSQLHKTQEMCNDFKKACTLGQCKRYDYALQNSICNR